jgi:hypothetical protein
MREHLLVDKVQGPIVLALMRQRSVVVGVSRSRLQLGYEAVRTLDGVPLPLLFPLPAPLVPHSLLLLLARRPLRRQELIDASNPRR